MTREAAPSSLPRRLPHVVNQSTVRLDEHCRSTAVGPGEQPGAATVVGSVDGVRDKASFGFGHTLSLFPGAWFVGLPVVSIWGRRVCRVLRLSLWSDTCVATVPCRSDRHTSKYSQIFARPILSTGFVMAALFSAPTRCDSSPLFVEATLPPSTPALYAGRVGCLL